MDLEDIFLKKGDCQNCVFLNYLYEKVRELGYELYDLISVAGKTFTKDDLTALRNCPRHKCTGWLVPDEDGEGLNCVSCKYKMPMSQVIQILRGLNEHNGH